MEDGQEYGRLHIYCGEGKGKTTASVGLAVRAAGAGQKVVFVQFMKGGETSELRILEQMSEISILRCTKEFPFYHQMREEDKAEITAIHNDILQQVGKKMKEGMCNMLILDELTYPYSWKLLDRTKVDSLISDRAAGVEIVITGRNPDPFFLERADYITEMKNIRHPFDQGIQARKGIEY